MTRTRAYTPREVGEKRYNTLPWEGEWQRVFGQPAVNELWFISGASAQGKSSFVMQLSKKLCEYGRVLYVSGEEGIRQSFQRRLRLFHMEDVNRRFFIIEDTNMEALTERLAKHKSPRFVVIDSFQVTGWTYEEVLALKERFPKKTFIYISQEYKSAPMGKSAVRLRYIAGVKVRVSGFVAMCMGRESESHGRGFVVWEEGAVRYGNSTLRTSVDKTNTIITEHLQ